MPDRPIPDEPWAWFANTGGRTGPGLLATQLVEVTHDPTALDRPGFWAVVADFEGCVLCARFADVRDAPAPGAAADWRGPPLAAWRSNLDAAAYTAAVERIRGHIADGTVYQVNLCRTVSASLPEDAPTDLGGLHQALAIGNPAPYACIVHLPDQGVRLASASPELFLSRSGDDLMSGPIKGTGRRPADLRDKDVAENVMITDLVRNDLGRVALTGSVVVPALCSVEQHPGLAHLVSYVTCSLAPDVRWDSILIATLPPGSVSGAPKIAALQIIGQLEPTPRGPYCGAIGWVWDRTSAVLAVGIRTFWARSDGAQQRLFFGTGAGIVWDSDPTAEWAETELKASRLLRLASAPR